MTCTGMVCLVIDCAMFDMLNGRQITLLILCFLLIGVQGCGRCPAGICQCCTRYPAGRPRLRGGCPRLTARTAREAGAERDALAAELAKIVASRDALAAELASVGAERDSWAAQSQTSGARLTEEAERHAAEVAAQLATAAELRCQVETLQSQVVASSQQAAQAASEAEERLVKLQEGCSAAEVARDTFQAELAMQAEAVAALTTELRSERDASAAASGASQQAGEAKDSAIADGQAVAARLAAQLTAAGEQLAQSQAEAASAAVAMAEKLQCRDAAIASLRSDATAAAAEQKRLVEQAQLQADQLLALQQSAGGLSTL